MTGDNRYNGWTNYPTWNVALWIGNDPGLDEMLREMARDEIDRGESENVYNLAARIKDWIRYGDEMAPDLGASMYADILGWALDHVNWDEIAQHALDDARE